MAGRYGDIEFNAVCSANDSSASRASCPIFKGVAWWCSSVASDVDDEELDPRPRWPAVFGGGVGKVWVDRRVGNGEPARNEPREVMRAGGRDLRVSMSAVSAKLHDSPAGNYASWTVGSQMSASWSCTESLLLNPRSWTKAQSSDNAKARRIPVPGRMSPTPILQGLSPTVHDLSTPRVPGQSNAKGKEAIIGMLLFGYGTCLGTILLVSNRRFITEAGHMPKLCQSAAYGYICNSVTSMNCAQA
ncbi:hypothetical protein SUNI508_00940 [Seiridium unicorne]|uniref:Uncharacterized protein n=1 Tax=Seiridium unicorne TaxID=138068 RepID=A0ABR2V205_9PEZI